MRSRVWPIVLFLILSLWGFLMTGCEEDFLSSPPFSMEQDTLYLEGNNFVSLSPEALISEGKPVFPFSYRLFNAQFEGFLLNAGDRVYAYGINENPEQRFLLFDQNLVPGDTIEKFSDFLYHLLLDRRQDDATAGEVYYLLRRRLIGMRSRRESMIWVISPQKGIIAAADYQIDPSTGEVSFAEIAGPPEYFDGQTLIQQLKFFDHTTTMVVDRERNLIYKFDKLNGLITSRDYSERVDLDQYQFRNTSTRSWYDFRLQIEGSTVKLINGDSCFYFTQQLELQRSGLCL